MKIRYDAGQRTIIPVSAMVLTLILTIALTASWTQGETIGGADGGGGKLNASIDEVAVYSRALAGDEVYDRYLRGAGMLNLLGRACNDSTCSTRGDEWDIICATPPCDIEDNVTDARYFQYKVQLRTDDENLTPYLMGLNVTYVRTELPDYDNFLENPETTDFDSVPDLENVENMTLATDIARIKWQGIVNATNQDFDENVYFGSGIISINASGLDESINTSALVTIEDVDCNDFDLYYSNNFGFSRFGLMKKGNIVADQDDVGDDCDNPQSVQESNVSILTLHSMPSTSTASG